MAFTDSANIQTDIGGPGSNDIGPGGPEGGQSPDTGPSPRGGPVISALQRQAQGPQVSAPGPGNMADSMGKLKIAIDLMQQALHGLDPGSQQHKDVLRSLQTLSKHLPQMGNQSGLERTHLMDLLRRGGQNPILQAISSLIGGGGGQQGGQGPQPPMPSTPLPGA